MKAPWFEKLTGSLEQKKQYRQLMTRLASLPHPYMEAGQAILRYVLRNGDISDGGVLVTLTTDLVELWEQAAADSTPIRDVVGDDPVEFAGDFVAAYSGPTWRAKEQMTLRKTIIRLTLDEEQAHGYDTPQQ